MSNQFKWKDYVTGHTYKVTINLTKVNGMYVLTGVNLESLDKEQITVETYRRVPIVKMFNKAREQLLPKPTLTTEHRGSQRGALLSDEVLEEVARIYKEACNYGTSPIKSVAKAFGISKSTAAKRVMVAREHGMLGQAIRGKSGER